MIRMPALLLLLTAFIGVILLGRLANADSPGDRKIRFDLGSLSNSPRSP
jgi:hypothetical protein